MDFFLFDPSQASEQDFLAITDLYAAANALDRPEWPPSSHQAIVGILKNAATGSSPSAYWLATENGRLVAVAEIELPQEENTNLAIIEIKVHPGFRRRGIGTEFLRVLLREARAAGRTRVMGSYVREGGPGEPWALSMGFERAHGYLLQDLIVADVDPGLWNVPTADGYRVRGWTAEAPEEVLASYARARHAILDAPTGGITWDSPKWTPERIRKEESAYLAADIEQRVVVAVHETTGDVVGLTELIIRPGQPDHGRQLDTAVLGEHRGHGLGRAIKAAMMRHLVEERPAIVRVSTQTAADNIPMATVNHQIGYRTLWTHYYFEADLEVLEERLGA